MKAIFHTGITVSNLERSIEFYRDVLGLEFSSVRATQSQSEDFARRVGVPGASLRLAVFKLGNGSLELLEYLTPKSPIERPVPPNALGSAHVAFQVDDINEAVARLSSRGVKFFSDVKRETGVLDGWQWVYFNDPDGIVLELVQIDPPAH